MRTLRHSFKFNRRKKQLKSGQSASVEIEMRYRSERKWRSIGISLESHQWDVKNERVIKHELEREYNVRLNEIRLKADRFFMDCQNSGSRFSLTALIDHLEGNKTGLTLTGYMWQELEIMNISAGTHLVYSSLIRKLEQYKEVLLSDVDYTFTAQLENWLLARKSGRESKTLQQSTVSKDLGYLKSFLKKAVQRGLLDKNPFDIHKIKRVKKHQEGLTREELTAIEQVELINQVEMFIRDAFLFMCYSSFRFSDVLDLEHGVKVKHLKIKAGQRWLIKESKKTGVSYKVPVDDTFGGAKFLIDRYIEGKSKEDFIFKPYNNRNFNKGLKAVKEKAGIERNITAHIGRHTFGMLVLEKPDVKLSDLKVMMGHKSLESTQKYSRATERSIGDKMRKANKKIG